MKATDLQINDWVYLSEKTEYPMQVTEIDKCNCLLDFEGGIAPIPLTDEMLESNGFYVTWETDRGKNKKLNYKEYFHPKSNISFVCNEILGYGIDISDNTIYIKYIHELQHLLRLCGFGDLADDLKIK